MPLTRDFKMFWNSSTASSIEDREKLIVEVQELEYCCRLALSEIGRVLVESICFVVWVIYGLSI